PKRVWCKQVEQHGGWWEVGIIINLKARWRLLRIAFELDVEKQKIGVVAAAGARHSLSWREAPDLPQDCCLFWWWRAAPVPGRAARASSI
ncbi:hypothetical protein A2U01_0064088, partial [Trifolium medium]|nr:hypothetical protein [Trifolium medium]